MSHSRCVLAFLLALVFCACSLSARDLQLVSFSSAKTYTSVSDLTSASEIVVMGSVVKRLPPRPLEMQTDSEAAQALYLMAPLLATDSVVKVAEVLKGDVSTDELLLVEQLGGESPEVEQRAEGSPLFQLDQRLVLFLKRYVDPAGKPTQRYVVLGVNQGQFLVEKGRAINRHLADSRHAAGASKSLGLQGTDESDLSLESLRKLVQTTASTQ